MRQDDRAATVAYRDRKTGRTVHSLSADYVVICLPLSIVAGFDCEALLRKPMAAVRARRACSSNSAKMGLAMKRRFWEEDDQIFGGHLYSNLPIGEFSYPSTGYFSQKGVLLGLATPTWCRLAGADRQAGRRARFEHVLMHSSKVHPQGSARSSKSAYSVFWQKVERYSHGGFLRPRHQRDARSCRRWRTGC